MGGGPSEYPPPPPSRTRNSQTFSCACVKRGRHSKFEDFLNFEDTSGRRVGPWTHGHAFSPKRWGHVVLWSTFCEK